MSRASFKGRLTVEGAPGGDYTVRIEGLEADLHDCGHAISALVSALVGNALKQHADYTPQELAAAIVEGINCGLEKGLEGTSADEGVVH